MFPGKNPEGFEFPKMESPSNLKEFHNYLRLLTIVSGHGVDALRSIFRSRYEELTTSEWKDGSRAAKLFHETIAKHVFKSCLPIQRKMLQDADLHKWDLALLSLVLQKINYSKKSPSITEQHERENKVIANIVQVRNTMEHLRAKTISLSKFNELWKQVSTHLITLGVSPKEIEHVRSCKDLHGIEFKNLSEVDIENDAKAQKLKKDGNVALKLGLFSEAAQFYSSALNLYGVSQVERGILHSNRSFSYMKLLEKTNLISEDEVNLNCDLAMQDANSAIELRPLWFKGYFRLGKVLQFMKEWGPATASFDQAFGLRVADAEILKERDSCLSMLNTAHSQEHIQPIRMLNQLETQEYNELMFKERGWTMPNSQKILEMYQRILDSTEDHEKYRKLKAGAYIYIGHRHKQGTDGFTQNYKKAAEFFTKAAELGNPEGFQNIGLLYDTGKGVPQDPRLAADYFEKAARFPTRGLSPEWIKKGVVQAQCALATRYETGVGRMQDFSEAVKWYTKATEGGNGHAAHNLGHLYNKGLGVIRSQQRAIQLWKLAASNGYPLALKSLATTELEVGNLNKAEHYYSQLVQTNNQLVCLNQTDFYQQLKLLKAEKEWASNFLTDIKTPSGVSMKTVLETFKQEVQKLRQEQVELPISANAASESAICKYWGAQVDLEIEHRASQGFIYAQEILTSKKYFAVGAELFRNFLGEVSAGNSTSIRNKMLRAFANCYRTAHIVDILPIHHRARLAEVAEETMRSCSEDVSDIDCDARICYALLTSNSQHAVNFLSMSKIKYPKAVFFPDLQVNLYGFRSDYKEALKIALEALKKFPQHIGLLENKAKLLFYLSASDRGMKNSAEEAIKHFLELAPADHRKVPDAYYCLGEVSFSEAEIMLNIDSLVATKKLAEAEKYYGLGLKSESNLLSCFIPYDSQHKKYLRLRMDLMHTMTKTKYYGSKCNNENVNSNSAQSSSSGTESQARKNLQNDENEDFLTRTSPSRIHLVLKQRKALKYWMDEEVKRALNSSTAFVDHHFTLKPLHVQRSPTSLADLTEIKLDEMSRTVDRVYEGRILTVIIIEDSLFHLYPSVNSVIKDDDGDFQWCYFYNFDHKDAAVRKKFSFGSKLSILNPYHRLTGDGYTGIRVDDPQSVVFHSAGDDEEPLCRFCWKKGPALQCAKCKRFKYCGKECQSQDWIMLKHKDVCVPSYVTETDLLAFSTMRI